MITDEFEPLLGMAQWATANHFQPEGALFGRETDDYSPATDG